MKTSLYIILFVLIAYELTSSDSQRLKSKKFNRPKSTQLRQGQGRKTANTRNIPAKRPRQQGPSKPRQGRQGVSKGSTRCDFAAHYVTDNADFFVDRTDGLFGEDWTLDNGCENHELGCCADDEDCKCFGIIEELDEELEIPPICFPLRRNMAPPQFCMKRPQRGRRNQN